MCVLLALKRLGLYKLWLGLTAETCEATKKDYAHTQIKTLVICAETRRNHSLCCRCGFAPSRSVNLHLPTFQMWPEAVGVQTRFASDGIEKN